VLFRSAGTATGEEYGWCVAGAGDNNGDGQIDLLIGAPFGDTPCPNAGSYHLVHPIIPPARAKVMITEVSCGDPDGVEITNFDSVFVNLGDWKILWKDGSTIVSQPLDITLAPGETAIVAEPNASFAEMPAGTQLVHALPQVTTHTGDAAVALVNRTGLVVDEVRLAGATGLYAEGSLGGRFRGYVNNLQSGGIAQPINAERTWGLDSNGGLDWTSGAPRSFGLENRSSGVAGYDPVTVRRVLVNETDDDPDYVEIRNASASSVSLRNWFFLMSANQNSVHVRIAPWSGSTLLAAGAYAVVGDSPTPPAEKPAAVAYFNAGMLFSGIPWGVEEYDCALYDAYGRLVDLVRTTGSDDNVVHNHPRAPSRWADFTGSAQRGNAGDGAIGRDPSGTDTNTGGDFHAGITRTMGTANHAAGSPAPLAGTRIDARLNSTNVAGGLALIINAGPDHAGEKWSFAFSYGHLRGQGPILGLGAEAISNWEVLSATPPYTGFLDAQGSARLDAPGGSLPPGFQADVIVLLQDPTTLAFTQLTDVLELDG
jgi:hypothetical protein